MAERGKIASFMAAAAPSPPRRAAWPLALARPRAFSGPAPIEAWAPLASASGAEGSRDDGPRDSEEAAFVKGICKVAGLSPHAEVPDAGMVLGMLSDKGKVRAMGPRLPKQKMASI